MSVTTARHQTNSMQKLILCAQTALKDAPHDDAFIEDEADQQSPPLPPGFHYADERQLDLQKLGCSESPETIMVSEVERFSYASNFVAFLGPKVALTLALSLAVYYLVRAIGWVVGGFAAS